MLSHTDLKKGTQFIFENQPWEVVDSLLVKMAQRRPVVQTKIKNLINGSVQEKNFQQGDMFDEAELIKKNIKFLYSSKGQYFFCEENNPAARFSFDESMLGPQAKFFKPNSLGYFMADIHIKPNDKEWEKLREGLRRMVLFRDESKNNGS